MGLGVQRGRGFREQDGDLPRPTQAYISISTVTYTDSLSGGASGARAMVQIAAGYSNAGLLRHSVLYDSGSGSINHGAGSRIGILPMLCDD